jgi:hypothetical protein
MQTQSAASNLGEVGVLLRGEPEPIRLWSESWDGRRLALQLGVIIVGSGLYGGAMGWWRDPLQALYAAMKFPLVILLTAAGNALLNAMLAPLLGLNISFRQSFLAILMSFAVAAAVLGAFSPLMAYLVWNAPELLPGSPIPRRTYLAIQLAQVAVIAFAGIAGNLRLLQLLRNLSRDSRIAGRVLVGWLAGNLFLGSQLTWILRPFIGTPDMPVEFLRATAFNGNFYESVFRSVLRLLSFD